MSLILDALRKLDREKEAPERGLLVLGAPEPRAPRVSGSGVLALALTLGGALGGALALAWLRGPGPGAAANAPMVQAGRVAAPATQPAAPALPAVSAPGPMTTPTAGPTSIPPAPRNAGPPPAAAPAPAPRAVVASGPAGEPQPPVAVSTAPPAPGERADIEPASGGAPPAPTPAQTPPVKPGGNAAIEPRLEAISERDGRPVAILSGRLVFEGDSFDGIQVVRIGASEVEIERDGRRQVLRF